VEVHEALTGGGEGVEVGREGDAGEFALARPDAPRWRFDAVVARGIRLGYSEIPIRMSGTAGTPRPSRMRL
jgi:hypothetical protein